MALSKDPNRVVGPQSLISRVGEEKKQELPDARLHQIISFIKSGIRIVGYFFIPFNLIIATGLLILSEVVGIVEELV